MDCFLYQYRLYPTKKEILTLIKVNQSLSKLYFINFANKLNYKVGSKNKLKRFKGNETFANVFQPTREEVV